MFNCHSNPTNYCNPILCKRFLLQITLIGLVLCSTTVKSIGQAYSISGYITDAQTSETLIGATILLKGTGKVAVTNKNGHYSITGIPSGKYELLVSHIGYTDFSTPLQLTTKGLVLDDIELNAKPLDLEAISIVAAKPDLVADKTIETSHRVLSPKMIRAIPTASNDVFAAIKYLPGIDRTESFSPLYTVRGGDPGENAVLLDGVMIYNPYHASASSGIFNALTIKNVDVLVGGFGAEYGGRNSSVLHITTKDGNPNKLHGELKPSTFRSRIFLEFPAGKNASMMVAGRYMFDVPQFFLFHNKTYFYDYNISYTNRINNRNRLTLKYFESSDHTGLDFNTFYLYLDNTFNLDLYKNLYLIQRNNWKNRAATVIHKFILSPRLFLRSQVYYSQHRSNNYSGIDLSLAVENEESPGDSTRLNWSSNNNLRSNISDWSVKTSLRYKMASYAELKVGAEYNNYLFSNSIKINDIDNGNFNRQPRLHALFVEQKLRIGRLTIRPGMRATNYQNSGWLFEPRFNLSLKLPKGFRLKGAYGTYKQYIISMNTNDLEMSQIVDYYYPLWDKSPSKSTHYIVGVEKKLTPNLSVFVDAYYKDILRTYTFDINQKSIDVYGFNGKLQEGNGEAYGIELLASGKFRKISGWMSYGYSQSFRQYPNSEINKGEMFVFDYNRPHTFKAVFSYQMTKNFTFNSSFVFLSGVKRSIETTTQNFFQYDPISNSTSYFPIFTAPKKNSAKMPPLLYIDASIEKKLISGFGKKLSDFFNADASYVSVTIKNLSFLYRNVNYYLPTMGFSAYYGKYLPLGDNYFPQVGVSYTIKF